MADVKVCSKFHFFDKKIKWRIESLDVVMGASNPSSQEADGRNTSSRLFRANGETFFRAMKKSNFKLSECWD